MSPKTWPVYRPASQLWPTGIMMINRSGLTRRLTRPHILELFVGLKAIQDAKQKVNYPDSAIPTIAKNDLKAFSDNIPCNQTYSIIGNPPLIILLAIKLYFGRGFSRPAQPRQSSHPHQQLYLGHRMTRRRWGSPMCTTECGNHGGIMQGGGAINLGKFHHDLTSRPSPGIIHGLC